MYVWRKGTVKIVYVCFFIHSHVLESRAKRRRERLLITPISGAPIIKGLCHVMDPAEAAHGGQGPIHDAQQQHGAAGTQLHRGVHGAQLRRRGRQVRPIALEIHKYFT